MLTHIHPSCPWFTCRARSFYWQRLVRLYVRSCLDPPSAQSPFARLRCYRRRQDVVHPVSGSYPSFIAPMDSCDEPYPSCRFRFLIRQVFAGCYQPLLGIGPSRCYLLSLCVGAWTPTPPRLSSAFIRFFPESFSLTLNRRGSARRITAAMQLQRRTFYGAAVIPLCSGSHTC